MAKVKGHGGASVNIQRDCYTMASVDGSEAEITLYGEIVENRPVDWWTGEPIAGSYIVLSEFMDDLKQIESASRIIMRINSIGGDAYASITIHNRLRELKGELTAIVDGVAMSGGSLIMCAADKVQVNPSSLIMIHKCLSLLIGRYNAEELQKVVASNESVDKAQAAIYKRKTGMDEGDILNLMGDDTYMTGEEAVEKGFADELLEDSEPLNIAASADGRSLFVRGRKLHLTPGMFVPDDIPTVKPEEKPSVKTNTKQPVDTGSNEGGNKPMAKTIEELRNEYPELTAQLESDAKAAVVPADNTAEIKAAVEAERQRQKEIDEIATGIDAALVQEAKYGENACTAQDLAFKAMKQQAGKGKQHLSDTQSDFEASGAGEVTPATPPANGSDPDSKEAVEAQAKRVAETYKKMMGGKKDE